MNIKCMLGFHDYVVKDEHRGVDGIGQKYHQKLSYCSRCNKSKFWIGHDKRRYDNL